MFTAGFMIEVWGYMNKSRANNKKISKILIGCDWLLKLNKKTFSVKPKNVTKW